MSLCLTPRYCFMGKKPIIGILGAIASGKSTVAAELQNLGCAVIDADKIAKDFLQTDEVKKLIRDRFGDSVFDTAGNVDKSLLANAVFVDQASVDAINAIIHPRVLKKTLDLIEHYQSDQGIKAVVLDMPLLMEVGWHNKCDKLIFVQCNDDIRLDRASKKRVLDKNILKKRENFQISLDKKKKISHYILNNNENLSVLIKQISEIFPVLLSRK